MNRDKVIGEIEIKKINYQVIEKSDITNCSECDYYIPCGYKKCIIRTITANWRNCLLKTKP